MFLTLHLLSIEHQAEERDGRSPTTNSVCACVLVETILFPRHSNVNSESKSGLSFPDREGRVR